MRCERQPIFNIFLLLIIGNLLITGCDDKKPAAVKPPSTTEFTFLELGADTIYSKSIRDKLRESLGSDSKATRTTIDLEINYQGFIEDFFQPIHRFNQLLNDASGARVEHDTIKLMYRYPQKKSRLFKSVRLLFSGQSKKPLFFNIVARKEGSSILETMREKYGDPEEIKWSRQTGQSYFWRESNDFLIVSKVLDRFGDPEYRIAIYYGDNIDELIQSEQQRIQQSEDVRKKAGKTAF